MEQLTNKEIQRRRMMTYFIEAARKIIDQEGLENLSLRKVAKEAGYNSATLYNYFKDVEHLSMMACMKYLLNYTLQLSKVSYSADPVEAFLQIWDIFCDNAYCYPHIFYTIFFNKHSINLNDSIQTYYRMFPDDLGQQSDLINRMLLGETIFERDEAIIAPLVEAGIVAPEDVPLINQIIVYCFKELLQQICSDPGAMRSCELKAQMRKIILRVVLQK